MLANLLKTVPDDIGKVFNRFPVPVLLMGLFTIIAMLTDFDSQPDYWEIFIGLILAAYVCVCIQLASDVNGLSANILLQIAVSLVVIAVVWFAPELKFNIWMAAAAILLVLGNAAFFRQQRSNARVWDFTHVVWVAALFAVAGSIIYLLGIQAIALAFDSLFGIEIKTLVNRVLLPIGFGFLAPLYWLSNLQPVGSEDIAHYEQLPVVSKTSGLIGTWLLVPMMSVYMLILLAYGVKILITGELPDNEVARLAFPFLILGTFTWLVLQAPFVKDNRMVKLFCTLWFVAVLPVSVMLAVVTWVRVVEYGWTPQRIALACCVIWAVGMGLYFSLLPRREKDIRYIPGFAAVLLGISSIAAGHISYASQLSRAKVALVNSGMQSESGEQLWQGKDFEETGFANRESAVQARGSIEYLLDADLDKTKMELFPGIDFMDDQESSLPEGSKVDPDAEYYKDRAEAVIILSELGLDDVHPNIYDGEDPGTLHYYKEQTNVDIAGFENIHGPYDFHLRFENSFNLNNTKLLFQVEEEDIVVLEDGLEIARFNLIDWAKQQETVDEQLILSNPLIEILNEPARGISLMLQQLYLHPYRDGDEAYLPHSHIVTEVLTRGF